MANHTRYEPLIYWVTARPGAGKSVLVSHVLSDLKEKKIQHAFFHFHAGIKASQSLAYFLRSIAYQMAASNTAVCDELGKLCDGGCTFGPDDARAIWAKIFRAGIFQVRKDTQSAQEVRTRKPSFYVSYFIGFNFRSTVLAHRCNRRMRQIRRVFGPVKSHATVILATNIHYEQTGSRTAKGYPTVARVQIVNR